MFHNEIIVNEKYPGLNPVIFGWEECESAHSFGPHVRPYWLLHYVISGTGIFQRRGSTFQVQPGEIFVIDPYTETYYAADAREPWQYIWIGFTADIELPAAFHQPVLRSQVAGKLFDKMRGCQCMGSGKSAYLAACLWELVSAVQEAEKPTADYLEQALSLMQAEYASDLNATKIANRLGLDRSYFATFFKRHTGYSPAQYLIRIRLEKAAELMRLYGQTPSVAAISVGYNDICNFSKAFKRMYGVAPGKYKKGISG